VKPLTFGLLAMFGGALAGWAASQAVRPGARVDDGHERNVRQARRLDEATAEIKRLSKNDEAFREALGLQLADVAERLYVAGITDEENKNIARWWCINGTGACFRTMEDCESMRMGEAKCQASRVAYCDTSTLGTSAPCVGSRTICHRFVRRGGVCIGVE
jgi:hypothetical protein